MKTEILIPMWPNKTATSDKLGCGTRYNDMDTCDSLWIPLRARQTGEGAYEFSDTATVWQDLSFYVWMSSDYGLSIELKAYNIHSADARKLELILKTLKWANKRLEGMGKTTIQNLPFQLVDICKRLGIKRSIQYRGFSKDEFVPVDEALQLINIEINSSFSRLKKAA